MGRQGGVWKSLLGPCGGGSRDDANKANESSQVPHGCLPEPHLTTINGLFEATPSERPETRDEVQQDDIGAVAVSPELTNLNDSELLQALETNFLELVGAKSGVNRALETGPHPSSSHMADTVEIKCYTDKTRDKTSPGERNLVEIGKAEHGGHGSQGERESDTKPCRADLETSKASLEASLSMKAEQSHPQEGLSTHVVVGATLTPDALEALANSPSHGSTPREKTNATPDVPPQVSPWYSPEEPSSALDKWLEDQQMQQLLEDHSNSGELLVQSPDEVGRRDEAEAALQFQALQVGSAGAPETYHAVQARERREPAGGYPLDKGGFSKLADRVSALEARCEEIGMENIHLRQKVDEYEKQCQDMMDRVARSNRQRELLRDKLKGYMQRNSLLDSTAKSLLDRAQKAEESNEELKKKVSILEGFIAERKLAEERSRSIEGGAGQAASLQPEMPESQDKQSGRKLGGPLACEGSIDASGGGSEVSLVWPAERSGGERKGEAKSDGAAEWEVKAGKNTNATAGLGRQEPAMNLREQAEHHTPGPAREVASASEVHVSGGGVEGEAIPGPPASTEGVAAPLCNDVTASLSDRVAMGMEERQISKESLANPPSLDLNPAVQTPFAQKKQAAFGEDSFAYQEPHWTIASSDLDMMIQNQVQDLYEKYSAYGNQSVSHAPHQGQHAIPFIPTLPLSMIPSIPTAPQPQDLGPRARGSNVKVRRSKKGKSPRKGKRKKASKAAVVVADATADKKPLSPRGALAAQVLAKAAPAPSNSLVSPRGSVGPQPYPLASPRRSSVPQPHPMASPRRIEAQQPLPMASPRASAGPQPHLMASPRGHALQSSQLFEPITSSMEERQHFSPQSDSYAAHQMQVPLRTYFSINVSGRKKAPGASGNGGSKRGNTSGKARRSGHQKLERRRKEPQSPVGARPAKNGTEFRSSRLFQEQLRYDMAASGVTVPWQ